MGVNITFSWPIIFLLAVVSQQTSIHHLYKPYRKYGFMEETMESYDNMKGKVCLPLSLTLSYTGWYKVLYKAVYVYAISVILHENYLLAIVGEDDAIHWADQNCLPLLALEARVALQSELSLHLISALKRNSQLQLQPKEATIQTFWLQLCFYSPRQNFWVACWTKKLPWWCKPYMVYNTTVSKEILKTSLTVIHKFHKSL